MSEPGTSGERHTLRRDWVRYLGTLASAAIERFPAASLFVLLFALAANRLVALPGEATSADWRFLFALLGAAAAATAMQLALEVRRTASFLRYALPTLAGILVGGLVFRSTVALVEVPLLLLAAVLAVPIAPFVRRERDGSAYWSFLLWGSAGAALAFVAVMVTISGLTTALELFRLFFGIGLSFEAYTHVYVTAFGLIGPMFALASLPATGAGAPRFSAEDRLIRLVRPLVEWIAPALLLLQGIVLHLYAPFAFSEGQGLQDAALLSTSFLVGVAVLRVFLQPFLPDLAPLARFFVRFWLWLLVVPLALILAALAATVGRGGIDEVAYVLIAVAIATMLIAAAQWVRPLAGDVVYMGAVPVLLLFAAAVGPLSFVDTVSRSQASLIETRFGEAIRGGVTLGVEEARDLRRSVTILAELRQLPRIAPVVGQERLDAIAQGRTRSSSAVADRLLAMLGAPAEGRRDESPVEQPLRTLEARAWMPIAVGDFDTVVSSVRLETGGLYRSEPTDPLLGIEGTVLTIRFGADEDRVDLAPLIAAMPDAAFDAGSVALPVTSLSTEGGRRIATRPNYLSVDTEGRPQGGHLTLLMRAADWRSLGGD